MSVVTSELTARLERVRRRLAAHPRLGPVLSARDVDALERARGVSPPEDPRALQGRPRFLDGDEPWLDAGRPADMEA